MVSTELLRRYPFFGFMTFDQLHEVALITEEVEAEADSILFDMGDQADALYLLLDGEVELHYIVIDEHEPHLRKDFLVGTINPGETVSISAVIEPYTLTATGYVSADSRLLRIDAAALRALLDADAQLALGFAHAMLHATMERLQFTRIQLAAATTPLRAPS